MSTYIQSHSGTYSESNARYVMGKIYDDFHAIAYRGFAFFEQNPGELLKWKEDLFFLMTNKVLDKFQIQFFSNGKEWAIEYVIKPDGSVQQDNNSGGVNYWQIPASASIRIVATWSRNKKHVEDHMNARGWTSGAQYVEGDLIDDGAYSKNGYGATKGRRGAWTQ